MPKKTTQAALTSEERRVVKALSGKGWRNQDIQALINTGRKATINGGRITGVKRNANQPSASDDEVAYFEIKKTSFDPRTGLNQFDDERLVRARESMILAVQIFNSAALKFKTEVFVVLANIAWTYLMHEYYQLKGVVIIDANGRSLPLSELLARADCPLSEDIKRNLNALKILRDKVEHLLLGHADLRWSPILQACCLNFDKTICELFGPKLTLANELSLALQFAKPSIDQLIQLGKYSVPASISALDAQLIEGMTAEQLNNVEFQFRVIYTMDAASKSSAHYHFINPESDEGKEIHNVLSKKVVADALYPLKPKAVVNRVVERTGVAFTSNDHVKAWKFFKVRPQSDAPLPENTDKRYCIYHPAHGDYTYSNDWVDRLVEEATNPERLAAVRAW